MDRGTRPIQDQQSKIEKAPLRLWHADNLADPHRQADKARRVRAMFAAIAPSYDLNNRLHSLWRDQAWRRAAVCFSGLRPGDHVLDVACGTGDLAMAFRRRGAGRVLGIDFTPPMLDVAAHKRRAASLDHVAYAGGDAMRLPVADASMDVVSIAFGIRNVADVGAALREFHRVLRPGGRVVILEFSLPRQRVLRGMYHTYFHHVLPRTASWIARDRTGAYRYLPQSVNTFLSREQMTAALTAAGFVDPQVRPLTLGIAALYRTTRP
jgi:demethylmenaquinone methyltransferase/2-methoxy-6-polyprenyl-1,4-benzoquinol methylase